MIYFDNSATTIPDESVLQTYVTASTQFFANPSSLHNFGMEAERLVEKSRGQIAALLRVLPETIVFTSGGTESNNLAIKGAAFFRKSRRRHIVTTSIEHPSVFEACQSLEKEGFQVTYVDPDETGIVHPEAIKRALTDDTFLVSVMHVNNETGAIQPIEQIGCLLAEHPHVLFHVDDVQGFGKISLDIEAAGIDLLSVSGHKLHGVKGTGFLYKKSGVQITPIFSGGGQELGMRSGTENTAGIAALARAVRLTMEADKEPMRKVSGWLRQELGKRNWVSIHTPAKAAAPHILNISIPGVKGEVLVHALEKKQIVVSTTSACSSKQTKPSRVLKAMNVSRDHSSSAVRISLSRFSTIKEARQFIETLDFVVPALSKKRNERK